MPGMARHENEITGRDGPLSPREMVGHAGGPAVFVGPEKTDVEIEPWKLEVVGIAPEKRDLLLWREHQPHVGVFLRPIEMVAAALIERDDVAPQARGPERLLFDVGHHLPAGSEGVGRVQAWIHGRLHPSRHVLDRHEHVELEIETAQLVCLRRGEKAIAIQIAVRRAELLQGVGPDMVVREHQAVGRDE